MSAKFYIRGCTNNSMSQISRQFGLLSTLVFVAFSIAAISLHAQTLNYRLESHIRLNMAKIDHVSDATGRNDTALANRAIAALKRLEADVILYRSLQDFEANGQLGRVSLAAFDAHLHAVTIEVEPLLNELSDKTLRAKLTNALCSFQDGSYWWAKIDQPRVVTITQLASGYRSVTPAETFFSSTMPYTVVMHWRQAAKYLLQAERLVTPKR
jgi:hypothetical protein